MVDLPAPMKPVRTRRRRWAGMPTEAVGAGSVFELSWLAGIITSPGSFWLVAVLDSVEHEKSRDLEGRGAEGFEGL